MTKKDIIKAEEKMHDHLMQAYEIAGNLRDAFTGIGADNGEGHLKEYCNLSRGKIYDIREKRARFVRLINLI